MWSYVQRKYETNSTEFSVGKPLRVSDSPVQNHHVEELNKYEAYGQNWTLKLRTRWKSDVPKKTRPPAQITFSSFETETWKNWATKCFHAQLLYLQNFCNLTTSPTKRVLYPFPDTKITFGGLISTASTFLRSSMLGQRNLQKRNAKFSRAMYS